MKSSFFIGLILLAGCSKNVSGVTDTQLPVITIITPTDGQTFTAGSPMNITGNISDNGTIAEVHVHVTNVTTGTKYLDVHLYPGASTTSFSNHELNAVSGINYKVEVIAIDRGANEARSSVLVSCN